MIAQPYSNHNGGSIKFGADGYLYIGMGDGGSGNDPEGRAQDKTTLLGKILRIDVNSGNPYAIPPGNPFANGVGGLPEIFTIGMRNPWRISFDRATGDFWIGDVGQGAVEEIDLLPAGTGAGANLGWRVVEGNQCTGPDRPGHVQRSDADRAGDHLYARVRLLGDRRLRLSRVVGAVACRHSTCTAISAAGGIWAAQKHRRAVDLRRSSATRRISISAFGEDDAGELYFADYATGDIYKFADTRRRRRRCWR